MKLSGEIAASLVLCTVADAARMRGDISKAAILYTKALRGLEARAGDSAVLGLAHLNLAECLEAMGRQTEAAVHSKMVAQILRQKVAVERVRLSVPVDLRVLLGNIFKDSKPS